jgi:NAD(P)-dependent dehydrogenase (short-subunit alcohol dehydrogenase family)
MVTAGASGIGRVIAEALQDCGHVVHVCDIDPATLQEFLDANPDATGSQADVADPGQVEAAFSDLVDHHGRLDLLVNNAGIAGPSAAVENIDPSDWERTLAVNLSGQFHATRCAVPLLKQDGGCIINMASTAGLHGCPYRVPYAAAKWAIIGMTKTLAMELGPHAIRVNAICPGSVEGERIDRVIRRDAERQNVSEAEIRRQYERQTSMRCFIEPRDIAAMAVFLASEAGRRISGQAIAVDGNTETFATDRG